MDIARIKEDFLKDDLYNSLKELFVGAVTWHAHPQEKDTHYLRDLGMFTCFVQARALYEFFYKPKKNVPSLGSTASAHQFTPSWKPCDQQGLYVNYMANETPAQERVFHLVHCRSDFSGGSAKDASDDLKNRVLDFAKDLKRLTQEFATCVEERYGVLVVSALRNALLDGSALAKKWDIPDPL